MPFLSLILKTSVKKFCPTLSASLTEDSSGNHDKNLELIVRLLAFLKTVPWCDHI